MMGTSGKKNILLVDDDLLFRESFRELLESRGYGVTEAANGIEAEKHLDSSEFDLTITDILMPKKDGLEFLRGIRDRNTSMKVIAITGGGRLGADKYLMLAQNYPVVDANISKPFNMDKMFDTISRLID